MKADIKQHKNGYIARLVDKYGSALTRYCFFYNVEDAEQYLSELYLDYYNDGI